jgi:hypothetical protein
VSADKAIHLRSTTFVDLPKRGIDSGDKVLFHFKRRSLGLQSNFVAALGCIIVVVIETVWPSDQILYKARHFQRREEKTSCSRQQR